ncbi:C-type mannose receptor 2-like [Labrus mixtus]|uniref:C-type mannose receptor 2-like n=1 Tax=Labrus mixtus TaxID=508554 RepID=UPI0029C06633|nr:C-type mannose receptor 2-like [Labrus mixtus]XP_060887430.1 C-type mannose receptor 2-like [Labrus mixtus]XP_060887431.1 C-type mannose receptor 2-like [Labrus mixtus]XP_060887432.1 C-type mannose receptor 2-like [Labrus mixtus]
MQSSLFLLTVMGQCVFFTCHHIEYHLNDTAKTWDEARSYCKERYTDLATVSDMTDMKRLLRKIVNTQEAWIGLQSNPGQDKRMWHWSLPGTQGVALNELNAYFPDPKPTNGNCPENCARLEKGEIHDTPCGMNISFICFNGTEEPRKSLICINESMNWTQAQNYCRAEYTDLVSGPDLLAHLADNPNGTGRWIGLFRDTWYWSDGSNSSFRHWNLGLLKDGVAGECATVLKGEGKWDSAACNERKHFVCYKDKVILIQKVMMWQDAVNYCREHHRDLVSITDLNQQRWVEARAKNASTDHVWLGLRYTCVMDLWFWLNDHLVSYENWDRSDGECDKCYHAAAMTKSGKWVKKADTEKFNFICALK